jgi:hypothetical protein
MTNITAPSGTEHPLPAAFQDLAPFLGWALAKEQERMQKRLASTMAEIVAFYEAMLARMEAVVEYLQQFPADRLPPQGQALFQLSLSFIEVANAVELYKQPRLPNGFNPARFVLIE